VSFGTRFLCTTKATKQAERQDRRACGSPAKPLGDPHTLLGYSFALSLTFELVAFLCGGYSFRLFDFNNKLFFAIRYNDE